MLHALSICYLFNERFKIHISLLAQDTMQVSNGWELIPYMLFNKYMVVQCNH